MKTKTIVGKELTEFGEFDKSKTVVTEHCYRCDKLEAKIEKLRAGLESISLNTCCDSCQEAKLVARKTLKEVLGE